MSKKRITVTVDPDVALYLEASPNKSLMVCEAVRAYSARELHRQLEEAYRLDHEESAERCAEWSAADAEVEERDGDT